MELPMEKEFYPDRDLGDISVVARWDGSAPEDITLWPDTNNAAWTLNGDYVEIHHTQE